MVQPCTGLGRRTWEAVEWVDADGCSPLGAPLPVLAPGGQGEAHVPSYPAADSGVSQLVTLRALVLKLEVYEYLYLTFGSLRLESCAPWLLKMCQQKAVWDIVAVYVLALLDSELTGRYYKVP